MTLFDSRERSCGRVLASRYSGSSITVELECGKLQFDAYGSGIVRIRAMRAGARQPAAASPAVVVPPASGALRLEEGSAETLRIAGPDGLVVSIARPDASIDVRLGQLVVRDVGRAFRWNADAIGVVRRLPAADRIYGLGEKTGQLEKSGRTYQMWNSDEPLHLPTRDPLYQSIPFFLQAGGAGVIGHFFDCPARSWFDIGDSAGDRYAFSTEQSWLDNWLIFGGDFSEVIEGYTALCGRIEMPPLWALGFHQCRYSYASANRVREIAAAFRAREIPCDAVWLDIHYMDGFRVFTWSPEHFPDPEALVHDLAAEGFRTVAIIDPGVKADAGYAVFDEGVAGDHFVRRRDGSRYIGKVWPGEAVFPDFSRAATRRFWADQHRALFDLGVAGIWNDMNEPADFSGDINDRPLFTPPPDVLVRNEGQTESLDRFHNLYGMAMCSATHDAFTRLRPDQRPFVLTRAGYAGIQRYAAVWTGDNHSWWEHLEASIPMLLNLGLSGVPFVGADAGGFQLDASAELYARWLQCASLTPFFRAHSAIGTRDHEPWSFGRQIESIVRQAIELRYSLAPYLYSLFYQAARDGTPVMRPALLHFPDDERLFNLNDQFMVGPYLMVAPQLRPGAGSRAVYLPSGVWYDFTTGERFEGPVDVAVRTPLSHLPLYVRAPAILPRCGVAAHLDANRLQQSTRLELYSGAAGSSTSFALYEDDGISGDWKAGGYDLSRFSLDCGAAEARLTVEPVRRGFGVKRTSLQFSLAGIDALLSWGALPQSVAIPTRSR